MNIILQPVLVELHEAGDGVLVFHDEWLVALLVRLSDGHGSRNGRWFLESGYGVLAERTAIDFADLAEAEAWIRRELQDVSGAFCVRLDVVQEAPLEDS